MQLPYYFPKALVDITITQTIGCYGTSDIRSTDTPTVTTSYRADYGSTVQYVKYQDFDGNLRDEDTAVTLTSDDRLSGINTSGTGEGAAFVKSAVALAGVFIAPHAPAIPFDPKKVCAAVATYNDNKGGAASLTTTTLAYTGRLEFIEDANGLQVNSHLIVDPNAGLQLEIPADAGSTTILKTLEAIPGATPDFIATVAPKEIKAAQPKVGTSFSGPTIQVPKMDLVDLVITGPAGDLSSSAPVWSGNVLIPTRIPVDVPVTAAPLFGKSATKVTLADSGLVTSLEYNKTSGAADLVTSATEVSTAAEGPTSAQQASDDQAKGNKIYEQHRLIECELDTAKCPQN